MKTKRKDSKLVRMLSTFGFCDNGMRVARRRYGKKTLQQAWRAATGNHLSFVLEKVDVMPPRRFRCDMCSGSCFWKMNEMTGAEFRSHFKAIPAKLRAAYAKA